MEATVNLYALFAVFSLLVFLYELWTRYKFDKGFSLGMKLMYESVVPQIVASRIAGADNMLQELIKHGLIKLDEENNSIVGADGKILDIDKELKI